MESNEWSVIRCPASRRAEALRQLHAGLPSDQRAALPPAIEAVAKFGDGAYDGLLISLAADADAASPAIQAAVWVQPLAGNTAVVWPPAAESRSLEPLLNAAGAHVDASGFGLAQIVVADGDGYPPDVVVRAGFAPLVELRYLYREVTGPQDTTPVLLFSPNAGKNPTLLIAALNRTYAGTMDCPSLDGVRSLSDVIIGYQEQGEYRPDKWYIVSDGRADVGVLILAYHGGVDNCEIIYMGVAAEARGRGYGKQIVQFALGAAAQMGAKRLVLAVDATNSPALKMYDDLSFTEWDRRIVYARLRAPA